MNSSNTSTALVPHSSNRSLTLVPGEPLPDIVTSAGRAAATAWHDFFQGHVANDHTRRTYARAAAVARATLAFNAPENLRRFLLIWTSR
jgi:hypothetical protein